MRFSNNDFSSKSNQIRSLLRIWSHLQNKSLMENFISCAVFSKTLFIWGYPWSVHFFLVYFLAAISSYIFSRKSETVVHYLHGFSILATFVLTVIGMVAAVQFRQISIDSSFHEWLGVITLILFGFQVGNIWLFLHFFSVSEVAVHIYYRSLGIHSCVYQEMLDFWKILHSVFRVLLVRIFPAFSRIRTVFTPNAGKCGENADHNNSKYGLFLRIVNDPLETYLGPY